MPVVEPESAGLRPVEGRGSRVEGRSDLAPCASLLDPAFRATCLAIEALILDVDGVMTDGTITIDDRGVESKGFFVRDGSAVQAWRTAGKRLGIISGRYARVVELRARELGIREVRQ